jgi:hypothetical protein
MIYDALSLSLSYSYSFELSRAFPVCVCVCVCIVIFPIYFLASIAVGALVKTPLTTSLSATSGTYLLK